MTGVNADNYMDYLGAYDASAVDVTRRTSSIVLPETDIRKRSLHPTITYETKKSLIC